MNGRGARIQRVASFLAFASVAAAVVLVLVVLCVDSQDAFAQSFERSGVTGAPAARGTGGARPAPSVMHSFRFVGESAPLSASGSRVRSCGEWRAAFGVHFDALRDLNEVTQALARDLDAAMAKAPQASSGDLEASQEIIRTLQRISSAYRERIDVAAQKARESGPSTFFEDFDARLVWSVPLAKLASPLGSPTMIASLRQVSATWAEVRFAGGMLADFFDGATSVPALRTTAETSFEVPSEGLDRGMQMRDVRVAIQGGGALRVEVATRPFERCLMEPSFGGQLTASGAAGLVAPITFLVDLSKTALFENTLRPNGDIEKRTFGETVRVRLGL